MVMVAYALIVVAAVIIIYTVCRWVNHVFEIKEIEYENVYKAGLIDTAAGDIQWLSEDFIKKFNDSILEMSKKFME